MKTIICCLFLLLATEAARAQSESVEPTIKRNTIFVELGGPLAAYSINYDRRLRSSSFVQLSVQGGLSGYWWNGGGILLPATFNGFVGKGNHHFNVGIGMAYSNGNEELIRGGEKRQIRFQSVDAIARIGYRLQKPQGGFFLSVAYTPFVPIHTGSFFRREGEWYHWAGIGLGRTF